MFATIWMCTHEWSLISIRATAFTLEACHQALSWSSALTRSSSARLAGFARGRADPHFLFRPFSGLARLALAPAGDGLLSLLSALPGHILTPVPSTPH